MCSRRSGPCRRCRAPGRCTSRSPEFLEIYLYYQSVEDPARYPPGGVLCLASASPILYPRVDLTGTARRQCPNADAEMKFSWRMWWLSVPSGATKARARSSTGCRSRLTSLSASRAGIMPATHWSSATRCINCRCCRPASCAAANCRSSATASSSIRRRCSTKSPHCRSRASRCRRTICASPRTRC